MWLLPMNRLDRSGNKEQVMIFLLIRACILDGEADVKRGSPFRVMTVGLLLKVICGIEKSAKIRPKFLTMPTLELYWLLFLEK